MAKVKVLGFRKLKTKMKTFLGKDVADKELLEEVGEFTKDRIFKFTKSGKSIADGTKAKPLKPLSDGYKKFRKGYKGRKGSFFKPNKSQLTLTGQMLDAITFKVDQRSTEVEVFVKDTTRSSAFSGKRRSKPTVRQTNQEVAKKVTDEGRPFIGIDNLGVRRIKQLVISDIREKINKKFK